MNKLPESRREAVKALIAKHESNGNYNVVIGGAEVPLTDMTVQEVMRLQDRLVADGKPSGAVGKYQVIGKTLKSIVDKNPKEFPLDRKFDEAAQERIADILLDRRGFKDFEQGKKTDKEMAFELSKEWASLPNPDTGKSYYDGDGINASHHKVEDVYKVLNVMEARSGRPNGKSEPQPDPVAGEGIPR